MSASSFVYIQPKSKNYCRLCDKTYNDKTKSPEGRFKIFKKKNESESISQRLSSVGLLVDEDPNLSETICRACERKIKKIEEANRYKEEWVGVKRKRKENIDGEPSNKKQKIQSNHDFIHQQVGKYI